VHGGSVPAWRRVRSDCFGRRRSRGPRVCANVAADYLLSGRPRRQAGRLLPITTKGPNDVLAGVVAWARTSTLLKRPNNVGVATVRCGYVPGTGAMAGKRQLGKWTVDDVRTRVFCRIPDFPRTAFGVNGRMTIGYTSVAGMSRRVAQVCATLTGKHCADHS
jgi:hypothetical protein